MPGRPPSSRASFSPRRLGAAGGIFTPLQAAGAGAAGFTCAKYFLSRGVRKEILVLTDKDGVVYKGRGDGNYLDELAAETRGRKLGDVMEGADVFVGVSAPGVLTPEM